MRVLAIDTALEACSAAVLDIAQPQAMVHETLPMARGHAEALMPMIDRVVRKSGLQYEQFDRIAVTIGPGSFTGLRVGIAAARGIALAAGKPAIGLSTLAALAAPLIAEDDSGAVVAAIDARHDHVYLQVFGPGGRTLVTPRVTPVRDAVRAAFSGAPVSSAAAPSRTTQSMSGKRRGSIRLGGLASFGQAFASSSAPLPTIRGAPEEAARTASRTGVTRGVTSVRPPGPNTCR